MTKKQNKRTDIRIVRRKENEAFKKGGEYTKTKMAGRVSRRGYGNNIVDKN